MAAHSYFVPVLQAIFAPAAIYNRIYAAALQGPDVCAALAILNLQMNPDVGVEPDYSGDGAFQCRVIPYVIVAVRVVSQTRVGRDGKETCEERTAWQEFQFRFPGICMVDKLKWLYW